MDRAEAIERLELHRKACGFPMMPHMESASAAADWVRRMELLSEALSLGIAALREQEQREQGCEYCREYKSIVEVNGDFISLYETTSKGVFLEACTCDVVLEAKVPFCPMCGRKLREGADHE